MEGLSYTHYFGSNSDCERRLIFKRDETTPKLSGPEEPGKKPENAPVNTDDPARDAKDKLKELDTEVEGKGDAVRKELEKKKSLLGRIKPKNQKPKRLPRGEDPRLKNTKQPIDSDADFQKKVDKIQLGEPVPSQPGPETVEKDAGRAEQMRDVVAQFKLVKSASVQLGVDDDSVQREIRLVISRIRRIKPSASEVKDLVQQAATQGIKLSIEGGNISIVINPPKPESKKKAPEKLDDKKTDVEEKKDGKKPAKKKKPTKSDDKKKSPASGSDTQPAAPVQPQKPKSRFAQFFQKLFSGTFFNRMFRGRNKNRKSTAGSRNSFFKELFGRAKNLGKKLSTKGAPPSAGAKPATNPPASESLDENGNPDTESGTDGSETVKERTAEVIADEIADVVSLKFYNQVERRKYSRAQRQCPEYKVLLDEYRALSYKYNLLRGEFEDSFGNYSTYMRENDLGRKAGVDVRIKPRLAIGKGPYRRFTDPHVAKQIADMRASRDAERSVNKSREAARDAYETTIPYKMRGPLTMRLPDNTIVMIQHKRGFNVFKKYAQGQATPNYARGRTIESRDNERIAEYGIRIEARKGGTFISVPKKWLGRVSIPGVLKGYNPNYSVVGDDKLKRTRWNPSTGTYEDVTVTKDDIASYNLDVRSTRNAEPTTKEREPVFLEGTDYETYESILKRFPRSRGHIHVVYREADKLSDALQHLINIGIPYTSIIEDTDNNRNVISIRNASTFFTEEMYNDLIRNRELWKSVESGSR